MKKKVENNENIYKDVMRKENEVIMMIKKGNEIIQR